MSNQRETEMCFIDRFIDSLEPALLMGEEEYTCNSIYLETRQTLAHLMDAANEAYSDCFDAEYDDRENAYRKQLEEVVAHAQRLLELAKLQPVQGHDS